MTVALQNRNVSSRVYDVSHIDQGSYNIVTNQSYPYWPTDDLSIQTTSQLVLYTKPYSYIDMTHSTHISKTDKIKRTNGYIRFTAIILTSESISLTKIKKITMTFDMNKCFIHIVYGEREWERSNTDKHHSMISTRNKYNNGLHRSDIEK